MYVAGSYNQTCTIYGTGGTSFTAPYTVATNSGHRDGFLVKVSPTGAILWGATLRGGSNDGMNAVTVDPFGDPIVTAGFNGCCPSSFAGTIFGTTNSLNISSFGINYGTGVVAKFNSSGAVQWAARIYNRDASAGDITTDAVGNIYVTSNFRSWNSGTAAQVYDGLNNVSTLFNPGIGLGYLLKLAPNGATLWGTTFGNAGNGVDALTGGTGIDIDANGDVWVSGFYSGAAPTFYSTSGGNLTGPASTGNRGFVVKYSPAGQALALNTLQQSANAGTALMDIACRGSEVRACGYYSGGNLGLNDILFASYDLSANQQNIQTAGGAGEDYAYCIEPFGNGYLSSGSAANGASIGGGSMTGDASWLWNTTGGATSSLSYLWSTGATTASITVNPVQTTTYTGTISSGGTSCTDSITITVANTGGQLFGQDTLSICGALATLDAGTGYSAYNWNTGATTQSISVTGSGWYTCSVTNGNCSSIDSTYLDLLNLNIQQSDTSVCLGSSLNLNATATCGTNTSGGLSWELLIPGSSYNGNETNFDQSGFDPGSRKLFSVLRNGSVNRVYAFDLVNNTVNTLSSSGGPSEIYSYAYDGTNNRIVANRVGRDAVFALPVTGGSWQSIGGGSFDAESYGCNEFWNPVSNRFGYFGGYGFYSTKNWIFENNGSGWINPYPNNNNCNPARRVGSQIARNASGNKYYIFSGLGSCDGNQFASSCALGSPWPTDVGVYCWLRDIWELDLSTYQFTNVLPVNNASILREGSFAFDHSNNTFYLIGGNAPTSTYGVFTPFTMDILRFRLGIDNGFLPVQVSGTTPPPSGNGATAFDAAGNRIIYARADGIWALNLGGTCNPTYLWST
ncbi:MAG: hypothetical protein RLZZ630_582, partial [Bacteroidota bacterium]